jgi:hypothetical protein
VISPFLFMPYYGFLILSILGWETDVGLDFVMLLFFRSDAGVSERVDKCCGGLLIMNKSELEPRRRFK